MLPGLRCRDVAMVMRIMKPYNVAMMMIGKNEQNTIKQAVKTMLKKP